MSTSSSTSTLLPDADLELDRGHDDDGLHHHVQGSEKEVIRARLTNRAMLARCGRKVSPKPNPDLFPCCPLCNLAIDGHCHSVR
jgi:hypothetical protein